MSEKVFGRDDFLKMPRPKVEKVYVEILGGFGFFKKINALDQDSYIADITVVDFDADKNPVIKPKFDCMKLKYLVRVMCDENGKRIFKNEEYTKLGELDQAVVDELYAKALSVNEVSDDVLSKNFKATQGESLPSA